MGLRGERLRAGPPYLQAKWQENAVSSLHDFNIPSSERVILTARETMGRNDPLKFVFLLALATAPLAILKVVPALRENYVVISAWRISSSGQAGIEIFIRGIPNPYDVKSIIDQYRFGESALSTVANADAEQHQRRTMRCT